MALNSAPGKTVVASTLTRFVNSLPVYIPILPTLEFTDVSRKFPFVGAVHENQMDCLASDPNEADSPGSAVASRIDPPNVACNPVTIRRSTKLSLAGGDAGRTTKVKG